MPCCKTSATLVLMRGLGIFGFVHDALVDFIGERDLRWRSWWIWRLWERHIISWYRRGHPHWWHSLLICHPWSFWGGTHWWGNWYLWHPQIWMIDGYRWDRLFSRCCDRGIIAMFCRRGWILFFWQCVGAKYVIQLFNISCSFGDILQKGCFRDRIAQNSDDITDITSGLILWG